MSRFSHHQRKGQKCKYFLLPLAGRPLSHRAGFPLPLPLTSPSSTLLLDRPGSTSPRRRAGHPPPRGAYRGGRWAAREFGAGSCTGGVEQNVQVPKGGGRGIRIGPQGLPLLHRRALRLRLGLMDAPPRHLQGTPALPFPFAPDRSDPPWGRAEAFTVSLIRFVGWKRSVYRWFCCSTSGSENPERYAIVYLVCRC